MLKNLTFLVHLQGGYLLLTFVGVSWKFFFVFWVVTVIFFHQILDQILVNGSFIK